MMLWLTWHMWILLLLAFAGGVITGWVVRSRSDEPQRARPQQVAHTAATAGAAPAPRAPSTAEQSSASGDDKAAADKPEPDAASAPAPDAKSAMAMTAPVQAPGADAGPVTDGPQGETSGGAGAPEPAPSDDLTQIKGLGPKAAEKLNEAGVTKVSEIAQWSSADVERFDTLINGRGRIERDDWVGQAKQMAG